MNSLKEPMMEEAMVLVQQKIQVEHEKYQMGKRELQRLAKRQRDAALHNQIKAPERLLKDNMF